MEPGEGSLIAQLPYSVAVDAIRAKGAILGVQRTPCDFSNTELAELYCFMQTSAQDFREGHHEWKDEDELAFFKLEAGNLETTEFNSAWQVLRSLGEDDPRIKAYARDERQARFLEGLHADPRRYLFFNARRNAITQFAEIGVIDDISKYLL